MKTTITDMSSYDNVFYQAALTTELQGPVEVFAFDEVVFGSDDGAGLLAVSDHRPVAAWIEFPEVDDDVGGEWYEMPTGTGIAGTGEVRTNERVRFAAVKTSSMPPAMRISGNNGWRNTTTSTRGTGESRSASATTAMRLLRCLE